MYMGEGEGIIHPGTQFLLKQHACIRIFHVIRGWEKMYHDRHGKKSRHITFAATLLNMFEKQILERKHV